MTYKGETVPIILDQFLDRYEHCLDDVLIASLIKQIRIELNLDSSYKGISSLYSELLNLYDLNFEKLNHYLGVHNIQSLQHFVSKQL